MDIIIREHSTGRFLTGNIAVVKEATFFLNKAHIHIEFSDKLCVPDGTLT